MTRFINSDVLAGPLRAAVIKKWGPGSHAHQFIGCPWCVSIWTSAAGTTATWYLHNQPWYLLTLTALSISYGYSLLAQHLD